MSEKLKEEFKEPESEVKQWAHKGLLEEIGWVKLMEPAVSSEFNIKKIPTNHGIKKN